MKILWKYVIKELIGPFFFALAVITFVLLMDFILDVLNKIINKGLPINVVLEVFALSLAWMLALSVPMAVLIAALMGYGRLSSDSEVIACKACGVSLVNLLVPGLHHGRLGGSQFLEQFLHMDVTAAPFPLFQVVLQVAVSAGQQPEPPQSAVREYGAAQIGVDHHTGGRRWRTTS